MNPRLTEDLVVLVPDKDYAETMTGLLKSRPPSLGMREITFRVHVETRHDPAVFGEAEAILDVYLRTAAHALVLFDHDGSGQEHRNATDVESEVRARVRGSGWGERAEVIVISPEIESWVWSDSPQVDSVLGWSSRTPGLRNWLRDCGLWKGEEPKPSDPKQAMEAALAAVHRRRSSAHFRQLAEQVSLLRCQDQGFRRLCDVLRRWFPATDSGEKT